MNKLIDILKSSSLSTTMSDMEIEEVVDEIKGDFEDFLEEEKEKIKENAAAELGLDELEEEIKDLKEEIFALRKRAVPGKSLDDVMTIQWVKEHWETLVKIQKMNLAGSLTDIVSYGQLINHPMIESVSIKMKENV